MNTLGIAIPTYNREKQLDSLLQTVPADIPIYISDNGACLTQDFKHRFPWAHVVPVTSGVIPAFQNWNRAARMVAEDWLMIPSDDDIYYPHSFETIRQHIEDHADADMIVFGHYVVDEDYRIVSQWVPPSLLDLPAPEGFEQFKYGVDARMPSIVFRRELLNRVGFFDEEFKVTAGDSYMIQCAALTGRSVFVPLIVSGYRVWEKGATYAVVSTPEWMKEVEQWGEKLGHLLDVIPMYAAETGKIRAEIYARNLQAGLYHLRRKGLHMKAIRHFLTADFPWKATRLTQLKLLYQLIRKR